MKRQRPAGEEASAYWDGLKLAGGLGEILITIYSDGLGRLALGLGICLFFAYLSNRLKVVDLSGAIASLAVGIPVFSLGGWKWFLILLVFFTGAAGFTKFKYEAKRRKGAAQEKGGARAWTNVLGNGGAAVAMAALEFLSISGGASSADIFLAGFLGAVSTTTADTLATEIGLLYPHDPRLIVSLRKRVPPGTSGGVTPLGESAAIASSLLIGAVAWALQIADWSLTRFVFLTLSSGLLGSLLDSLLGATVQGVFQCDVCGKISENEKHCGVTSRLVRGKRSFQNSAVNLVASVGGGAIACLMHLVALRSL